MQNVLHNYSFFNYNNYRCSCLFWNFFQVILMYYIFCNNKSQFINKYSKIEYHFNYERYPSKFEFFLKDFIQFFLNFLYYNILSQLMKDFGANSISFFERFYCQLKVKEGFFLIGYSSSLEHLYLKLFQEVFSGAFDYTEFFLFYDWLILLQQKPLWNCKKKQFSILFLVYL